MRGVRFGVCRDLRHLIAEFGRATEQAGVLMTLRRTTSKAGWVSLRVVDVVTKADGGDDI